LSDLPIAEGSGYAADTMVLAMFVDAGRASLLSDLAGGRLYVTPSVIDPDETPPFVRQPIAEFAKGVFAAQRDLSRRVHAKRIERRTAFYQAVGMAWQPVSLSYPELVRARYFASPAARLDARRANPALRVTRTSAGEAECAAVAVTRGWTLWSDDTTIVNLLAALHPGHPVERISHLLMRAVREGLLPCQEAADLYNDVFKRMLGLWTSLTLACDDDSVVVRSVDRDE
jgi:hypothetical protein